MFAVAALLLLAPGLEMDARAGPMESTVKAVYLYKFAPFVEWPSSAFASPTSPFQVCVLGEDPFGADLDRAVQGQQIDGHPMTVRRLQKVDAGSGCHILYLGPARRQSEADALRAVRGAPTLTVADQTTDGAIIHFVVRGSRVRFDIDLAAAAANHLAISSKLLSLATAVRPDRGRS